VTRSVWEEARTAIVEGLNQGLQAMGVSPSATLADVAEPTEAGHGDLTSNLALKLARSLKRAPRDIAQDLARLMPPSPVIETVEAAGPGFLNVTLSTAWLAGVVAAVRAAGADYGRSDAGGGERVLLEFVSANPVGPLVAVNGRAASVGDALARLLTHAGYRVDTEFYINDGGVQVEKLGQALWLRLRELAGDDVESSWPEGVYPGDYVKDVARLYRDAHGMPEAPDYRALGRFGADYFVAQQRELLERFGVPFDHWVHERELREAGAPEAVVAELRRRGYTREEDGALWFISTQFGDDKDRVIVKGNGEFTYLVPDIAYHTDKFRRGYDRAIDLLGPDHHGYLGRIRAGVEAMTGRGAQLEILIIQMVRLLRDGQPVKMSKRRGDYVPLEEVLDEVGVDAARFFFVERAPETPMEFDLSLAQMSTQANPVYYVQYAGARIHSILRQRGRGAGSTPSLARLREPAERALLVQLARFPELVARAALERSPHLVPRYLMDLAGLFHSFYRQHRVLGEEPDVEEARVALLEAVLMVLTVGSGLIGVHIPDSM
jgi:arginyl-tRNA synthetase